MNRTALFAIVVFSLVALPASLLQGQLRKEEPVLELLKSCGGELAVGLIRDESNRSLLQVRVEPPPIRPLDRNAFRAVAVEEEWRNRYTAWESETDQDTQWFIDQAQPLLEEPELSERTLTALDSSRSESLRLQGRNIAAPLRVLTRLAEALLHGNPAMPANVLLVGPPGSGKTELAILPAPGARHRP